MEESSNASHRIMGSDAQTASQCMGYDDVTSLTRNLHFSDSDPLYQSSLSLENFSDFISCKWQAPHKKTCAVNPPDFQNDR